MLSKVLIANRGEISVRISRTAHRLGIQTVAVYSEADAGALHVQAADEAVCLGPAPSRESYLRIAAIIAAARACGAEAIHPGYGFLSENAEFARACREAGLIFIGPSPEAITAMGSKSGAKALMEAAGVPLIPGYHGDAQDEQFLLARAVEIGFPVLLKASAGGGGKGMRAVHDKSEFLEALHAARREAGNAFGDERMLIEKLLVEPRHIEVQILADRHGSAIYVFDRDCSIQRRHQKVVEEAPAPGLSAELRRAMGEAAVRAAQAIRYEGAGTLEFLVDRAGNFYFMEMNTRLQVEHPVTELISGLDLVELQLRIAQGEPLPFTQEQLTPRGHAVEVRLYAEDPRRDFLPSTGTLQVFDIPAGESVRVDTGYRHGDTVSIHYDPMMAKVIAWGSTRREAVARLGKALRTVRIAGVKHNAGFLVLILSHQAFIDGQLNTHFIEQHKTDLLPEEPSRRTPALLLAAMKFLTLPQQYSAAGQHSPWQHLRNFRIGPPDPVTLRIQLNDQLHEVTLTAMMQGYRYTLQSGEGSCSMREIDTEHCLLEYDGQSRLLSVALQGDRLHVFSEGEHMELIWQRQGHRQGGEGEGQHYRAPMNGRVVSINVKTGDRVSKGDTLLVMEAMKMEHRIRAHDTGMVSHIGATAGELVNEGQTLIDLEHAST